MPFDNSRSQYRAVGLVLACPRKVHDTSYASPSLSLRSILTHLDPIEFLSLRTRRGKGHNSFMFQYHSMYCSDQRRQVVQLVHANAKHASHFCTFNHTFCVLAFLHLRGNDIAGSGSHREWGLTSPRLFICALLLSLSHTIQCLVGKRDSPSISAQFRSFMFSSTSNRFACKRT